MGDDYNRHIEKKHLLGLKDQLSSMLQSPLHQRKFKGKFISQQIRHEFNKASELQGYFCLLYFFLFIINNLFFHHFMLKMYNLYYICTYLLISIFFWHHILLIYSIFVIIFLNIYIFYVYDNISLAISYHFNI